MRASCRRSLPHASCHAASLRNYTAALHPVCYLPLSPAPVIVRSLSALCPLSAHSLPVVCPLSVRSLSALCPLSARSLPARCPHSACALPAHSPLATRPLPGAQCAAGAGPAQAARFQRPPACGQLEQRRLRAAAAARAGPSSRRLAEVRSRSDTGGDLGVEIGAATERIWSG